MAVALAKVAAAVVILHARGTFGFADSRWYIAGCQAVSFFFMAATVNLTAALLTQSAVVFYVFVYTMGLKRSTPQNIVIGGAAGAVPVLVGWAASGGTVAETISANFIRWRPYNRLEARETYQVEVRLP